MAGLKLEGIEPWAPHPKAAPQTSRGDDGNLIIAPNGTRTCCGGWQVRYSGVRPGKSYRFTALTRYHGVEHPRDQLRCMVHWRKMEADENLGYGWSFDYLLPEFKQDGSIRWDRVLRAPEKAGDQVTIRCTFRWSTQGRTVWSVAEMDEAQARQPHEVKIAVVTGAADNLGPSDSIQDRLEFYGRLAEAAATEGADLILLPEVAPQWRVEGGALDQAIKVPGPESDIFASIARRHRTHVVFPTFERDGDAVYNSCVLIGPDGRVVGSYHKVHLATGEALSGVLPGNAFPVFETEIGRIGFNICMDSSAAESSRMVGLNGADIALMPIMGDFRSWKPAPDWEKTAFDPERWLGIMRTRAMDNQYCFAVARNQAEGSVIIDRLGTVLAYNDGSKDHIVASVKIGDWVRGPNTGGHFRDVTWWQRRPHVYGDFTDEGNLGSLE